MKHVGEFESVFLSDLEGGKMPSKESYCGLEGKFCELFCLVHKIITESRLSWAID